MLRFSGTRAYFVKFSAHLLSFFLDNSHFIIHFLAILSVFCSVKCLPINKTSMNCCWLNLCVLISYEIVDFRRTVRVSWSGITTSVVIQQYIVMIFLSFSKNWL